MVLILPLPAKYCNRLQLSPLPLSLQPIDWDACYAGLEVDRTVPEVKWATPGTAAGLAVLQAFVTRRLPGYSEYRNNPNKAALSNLSPWFHFGEKPRGGRLEPGWF